MVAAETSPVAELEEDRNTRPSNDSCLEDIVDFENCLELYPTRSAGRRGDLRSRVLGQNLNIFDGLRLVAIDVGYADSIQSGSAW